jgi:hypothetical protein
MRKGKVSHVICTNAAGLTCIPPKFLANVYADTIDFSQLAEVTEVSEMFMVNCKNIRLLDLSPFRNVRIIGEKFLQNMGSLQEVDLRPMENVTSVPPKSMCPNAASCRQVILPARGAIGVHSFSATLKATLIPASRAS